MPLGLDIRVTSFIENEGARDSKRLLAVCHILGNRIPLGLLSTSSSSSTSSSDSSSFTPGDSGVFSFIDNEESVSKLKSMIDSDTETELSVTCYNGKFLDSCTLLGSVGYLVFQSPQLTSTADTLDRFNQDQWEGMETLASAEVTLQLSAAAPSLNLKDSFAGSPWGSITLSITILNLDVFVENIVNGSTLAGLEAMESICKDPSQSVSDSVSSLLLRLKEREISKQRLHSLDDTVANSTTVTSVLELLKARNLENKRYNGDGSEHGSDNEDDLSVGAVILEAEAKKHKILQDAQLAALKEEEAARALANAQLQPPGIKKMKKKNSNPKKHNPAAELAKLQASINNNKDIPDAYVLSTSPKKMSPKHKTQRAEDDVRVDDYDEENWKPKISSVIALASDNTKASIGKSHMKSPQRQKSQINNNQNTNTNNKGMSFFDTLHPPEVNMSQFADYSELLPVPRPKIPQPHCVNRLI